MHLMMSLREHVRNLRFRPNRCILKKTFEEIWEFLYYFYFSCLNFRGFFFEWFDLAVISFIIISCNRVMLHNKKIQIVVDCNIQVRNHSWKLASCINKRSVSWPTNFSSHPIFGSPNLVVVFFESYYLDRTYCQPWDSLITNWLMKDFSSCNTRKESGTKGERGMHAIQVD